MSAHPTQRAVWRKPAVESQKREAKRSSHGSVDEHAVTLLDAKSFAATQYRGLSQRLYAGRPDLGVVAVCSPGMGEGKSTTAINLAGALARDGNARVLLIDADLRRPALARRLGLGEQPGLAELILDPSLVINDVLVRLPMVDLALLPAGYGPDDPCRALQSRRWDESLASLRRRYDRIIIDTPPLLLFPDCGVLAPSVDGFLLVVAAHRTPRHLLEEALNALDPEKLVGLVFNEDDQFLARYEREYSAYYSTRGNHDH